MISITSTSPTPWAHALFCIRRKAGKTRHKSQLIRSFPQATVRFLIGCCGAILPKAQPHRNCGPLTPPYPLTENLDPFWLSAQPRPLQRQHVTKSALASPYSAQHDTWLAHAGNSGPHTGISRTRNQESCRFFEKLWQPLKENNGNSK
jgi:hypothetical protein